MKKVIFLDFDGVLLPQTFEKFMDGMHTLSNGKVQTNDKYDNLFAPHCIDYLKTIIENTNAKCVVTSQWRNSMDYDKIKEMFSYRYGNQIKIIGVTPILNGKKRGEEIAKYLKNNKVDKYVILDDMDYSQFEDNQREYLVKCNEILGITTDEVEKSIELLNN